MSPVLGGGASLHARFGTQVPPPPVPPFAAPALARPPAPPLAVPAPPLLLPLVPLVGTPPLPPSVVGAPPFAVPATGKVTLPPLLPDEPPIELVLPAAPAGGGSFELEQPNANAKPSVNANCPTLAVRIPKVSSPPRPSSTIGAGKLRRPGAQSRRLHPRGTENSLTSAAAGPSRSNHSARGGSSAHLRPGDISITNNMNH